MKELSQHDRQVLKEYAKYKSIDYNLEFNVTRQTPSGHKWFKVEYSTGILTEATLEEFLNIKTGKRVWKKLKCEDGFWYVCALNMDNAERKLKARLKKFIHEHAPK